MKTLSIYLMILIIIFGFQTPISAQVPQQDSLALVALYDSTEGANWTNNTNWLSGQPVSTWYGITVSSNQITEINLSSNNLSGTIPPELYTLTDLVSLNLGWNYLLGGSIPPEIGNLTNLSYLDLNANSLDGPIPIEICNLINLTSLQLMANSFSDTIPSEICNLINLTSLRLRNNNLTGPIPSEIDNLTNLTSLWADDNSLDGIIPPEIGNLPNLNTLFLDYNSLSGSIPPEIGNLSMLYNLQLHNNLLTGSIPNEIGKLTNLFYLKLSNNLLTGPIPDTLRNLTALRYLYLAGNQLSGLIPDFLGNLTIMDHLDLSDNLFTGNIPANLGNLPNLMTLYLGNNQLSGSIPAEIGNLSNLSSLFLHGNQLTGAVPDSIINLSNLSDLGIENNNLEDLPDLNSLTNLSWLVIQDNRFTFEDIESNIGVASQSFTYSPQDSVGENLDTTFNINDYFEFSVTVGGTANQYQWTKDATDIPGATDSVYVISNVAVSDAGEYICKITNTIATDLTLYSKAVNVEVIDPSGFNNEISNLPKTFQLYQNFPNPFNPETQIKFAIPHTSHVKIEIYNLAGQHIETMLNAKTSAGYHSIEFNANHLSSGLYLYSIKTDAYSATKKMLLIK